MDSSNDTSDQVASKPTPEEVDTPKEDNTISDPLSIGNSKDDPAQSTPKPCSETEVNTESNAVGAVDDATCKRSRDDEQCSPASKRSKNSSDEVPSFENHSNRLKFAFDEYNDPIDILAQNACTRSEPLKGRISNSRVPDLIEEYDDLILEDKEREKEGVARKEDCYFRNTQPLEYVNEYDFLIFEDEERKKDELARRRELGEEQLMRRLALEYAEIMASGGSTEEFLKRVGIR
ncbi:uncharacterized protein LOC135844300 [Planococcus citri]|uniref:uncharacterized protein LOC135844300 n=1 Tax=Planococcus citri TaxID=170843 RepID=UPI0031F8F34C